MAPVFEYVDDISENQIDRQKTETGKEKWIHLVVGLDRVIVK